MRPERFTAAPTAPSPRQTLGPLVLAVAAVAYVAVTGWAMESTSFDVWGGLLIAPVLVALTVPLARRVARRERDSRMVTFILCALVLKLAASLVRFAVAFEVYRGVADAEAYHKAGAALADGFRQGIVDLGDDRIVGTTFLEILTGIVYSVTGPTKVGGFLIFSWLGFWGLYFFYRAFRIAVPAGEHRRYARLVFLLPSMLFWPSSIGKEAWMTFTIGLACLGAAKLFARQHGAYALIAAGAAGTAMIRPHITLIVVMAIGIGRLFRRSAAPGFGPIATVAAAAVLLVGAALAAGQVERYFGVDRLDSSTVKMVLSETSEQTGQGGSAFEGSGGQSPSQLPGAIVTIVFRPFPHEAGNPQMLLASVEGLLLLALLWRGRRRLRSLPGVLWRTPYAVLAASYVLLFCYAFSSFENFGILARQRVQMFPLLLVLLALPDSSGPDPDGDDAEPASEVRTPLRSVPQLTMAGSRRWH